MSKSRRKAFWYISGILLQNIVDCQITCRRKCKSAKIRQTVSANLELFLNFADLHYFFLICVKRAKTPRQPYGKIKLQKKSRLQNGQTGERMY